MKRLFAVLLTMVMFASSVACAATIPKMSNFTDEQLVELIAEAEKEIEKRAAEAAGGYYDLAKGDSGKAVRKLRDRLKELKYYKGDSGSSYTSAVVTAVEDFQREAGLPVTGIADVATQESLFAADAPAAKVYQKLNFNEISRDPDKYEGGYYTFSGKVLQVLEEEMDGFTYTVMRIGTRKSYDNVVYVRYLRADGEARILEDDRVTVKAQYLGLYTYETIMGGTVTLPDFNAEVVELKKD